MLKRNDAAHFDLLSYFEGRTLASGVFEGRGGQLKRRFTVDMMGRAEGSTLILEEHFLFDNGERQERTWTLTRGDGQSFTGTCEDAVSEARGRFEQGRAYLDSELRLKVGNRLIGMRFEDVFYDAGEGAVLNRSTVSKWGIRVGQVLILFRKA
ncbi:MAG: DUF3833 family protein [Aestuariivirga sp.]|nr:DUF3833 family protein [Aestuariivirga sp.]